MKPHRSAFVMTPMSLLDRRGLSPLARIVWIRLTGHRNRRNGQCNPTHSRLAEELGVSLHKIRRAIRELRHTNLLSGTNKCGRGNWYTVHDPSAIPHTVPAQTVENQHAASAPVHMLPVHQCTDGVSASLYEPDCFEPEERHDAAAAVVNTPWQAAAAASTCVECKDENPTPPAEGGSPGEPAIRETAEAVVAELMPLHPEPGNAPKAISEAEKLLASMPDEVPATVEAIRTSHAAWRVRWAEYGPGRFIPQLWRWIHDGDWRNAPAERKGVKSETYVERVKREQKESDEESYRLYAENGMWDALREYMGPDDVEVWRARIEAEAVA